MMDPRHDSITGFVDSIELDSPLIHVLTMNSAWMLSDGYYVRFSRDRNVDTRRPAKLSWQAPGQCTVRVSSRMVGSRQLRIASSQNSSKNRSRVWNRDRDKPCPGGNWAAC
jgi:hypothetical protein